MLPNCTVPFPVGVILPVEAPESPIVIPEINALWKTFELLPMSFALSDAGIKFSVLLNK